MTRPVFGVDRDPNVVMEMLRRGQGRRANPQRAAKTNPMVAGYGPGPEGKRCGSCVHLFLQPGTAGRYYKCEIRGVSSSVATDHRVRWPACRLHEEAEA